MGRNDVTRRGGFLPLAQLSPPSGGPARLYARSRLARVRALLGPTIGPQLVELLERGARVELVFAGRGWERALSGEGDALACRVAACLGRPQIELVVRSRPDAPPRRPVALPLREAASDEVQELPPRGELLERLARLGARFEERRRGTSDQR